MEDERKALLERLEDVKRKVDEAAKEAGREELLDKAEVLPDDVRWHMIGHLQSNKAKQLVHRVAWMWFSSVSYGLPHLPGQGI
eukprot:jgi/Pico_ML_1/54956/g90.t2